jgi:response regulator RpfG family c-di-GMP phosphodiesterase
MTHPIASVPPVGTVRPRVLLVDDEPRIVEGLERTLRREFDVVTALSGAAGLSAISAAGPFAVIVSDMRMPEMNGAVFLKIARTIAADAVRILLTGQSDWNTAISAINDGQIFRFLTKPCQPDILIAAVSAAAEQHRLVTAERVLLEHTLNGSIDVLTEVLALASPIAFGRAVRLKRTVSELAVKLNVPDKWQVEMAAMLSQLGCITLSPDTLDKLHRGLPLEPAEAEAVASLPTVADRLIAHLPRLEAVRQIIQFQQAPFVGPEARSSVTGVILPVGVTFPMGARLLRVAVDFDVLEASQRPIAEILETMRGRVGAYDPAVLAALSALRGDANGHAEVCEVRLRDVSVGMVFAFDVVATTGLVLIGRGQAASASLVERIRNHWSTIPLREPARVVAH